MERNPILSVCCGRVYPFFLCVMPAYCFFPLHKGFPPFYRLQYCVVQTHAADLESPRQGCVHSLL